MTMAEPLSIWTVYDHPADYPTCYVARRFEIVAGRVVATRDVFVSPYLYVIRAMIPGLVRIERSPEDDPTILESWM